MNYLANFIRLAGETATQTAGTNGDSAQQGGIASLLVSFGPLILIFVVMYFLMIRPQKKRQKEEQKMRNSLRAGDELTTIGGIKGRVLSVKEDTFVLETGNDRTKMTFEKWAIQTVHTKHETVDNDDDDFDDDDED